MSDQEESLFDSVSEETALAATGVTAAGIVGGVTKYVVQSLTKDKDLANSAAAVTGAAAGFAASLFIKDKMTKEGRKPNLDYFADP